MYRYLIPMLALLAMFGFQTLRGVSIPIHSLIRHAVCSTAHKDPCAVWHSAGLLALRRLAWHGDGRGCHQMAMQRRHVCWSCRHACSTSKSTTTKKLDEEEDEVTIFKFRVCCGVGVVSCVRVCAPGNMILPRARDWVTVSNVLHAGWCAA